MTKFLILLFNLLIISSFAHAEIKTYTGVGEYVMSDFETLDVAKQRAKLYAERNAQEQAGVFVESSSTVVDSQLTKDEINTMTSGIISVTQTDYQTLPSADGKSILIRATIKANIDSDEINKWLNKDVQERSTLVAQNQELKKAIEDQEKLIADLKSQLDNVKTQQDKENLAKEYSAADNKFLANQKVEEGNNFYSKGELSKAISCYDEAIKLDPDNYLAYTNRSVVYLDQQLFDKTIEDCDKAITIKNDFVLSYYNRAVAYQNKGNLDKSLADYRKTLELDPNFTAAYNNLGFLCYNAKEFDIALKIFNKGIEINPNFAELYNNRSLIFAEMKDFNKVIEDCNKAIQLKPGFAEAWYNRGNAYFYLNDYQQALTDYEKALELNPNFAQAANNRNVVLSIITKR